MFLEFIHEGFLPFGKGCQMPVCCSMSWGTSWWPCDTKFRCAASRWSSSEASPKMEQNHPAPSPSFSSRPRAGERASCTFSVGGRRITQRIVLPHAAMADVEDVGSDLAEASNCKSDLTRYTVNRLSRNCRKVAGSDTLKRAWVGPLPTLMVSKRGLLSSNMLSSVRSSPAQRATS